MNEINPELLNLNPVSLDELMNIAVQDRWDTKFLMSSDDIPALLSVLKDDYKVLEVNDKRIADYTNHYLDTADWRIFHQHRMGRLPRYKIRYRTYEHSGITFFEVKRKNQNGKTVKERTVVDSVPDILQNECLQNSGFALDEINHFSIRLKNTFQRIALANIAAGERITIDFNLNFSNQDNLFYADNLSVIELKQPQKRENGILFRFMRSKNIVPVQFSKYCIGAAKLHPQLPITFLTPAIRQMQHLMDEIKL